MLGYNSKKEVQMTFAFKIDVKVIQILLLN